jgi:hypothetical protein
MQTLQHLPHRAAGIVEAGPGGRRSAVHDQILAGDESRVVAGQQGGSRRNVLARIRFRPRLVLHSEPAQCVTGSAAMEQRRDDGPG